MGNLKIARKVYFLEGPIFFSGAFLVSENIYIGLGLSVVALLFLFLNSYFRPILENKLVLKTSLFFLVVSLFLGIVRQTAALDFSITYSIFVINVVVLGFVFHKNLIFERDE